MKRFFVPVSFLMMALFAVPALAQDSGVINLDDTSPSVTVVISLPPATTGTVALDLSMAAVTLTNEQGQTVFYEADSRIHGLELNIAPDTGKHTLMVERLPGATSATVLIRSLPELTNTGTGEMVVSDIVMLNQARILPLTSENPVGSTRVSVPDGIPGVVTVSYPGTVGVFQFVDEAGTILATSNSDLDGFNLVVEPGTYAVTLSAERIATNGQVGIQLKAAEENGFTILPAPEIPVAIAQTTTTTQAACDATITSVSVNLRSGPGQGYSILDYAFNGDTFPVGGVNPENNWVVIGKGDTSAWVVGSAVQFSGSCDNLAVFNVPFLDAQAFPVVTNTTNNAQQFEEHEEHEEHDDEDEDHEGEEHDDDDD